MIIMQSLKISTLTGATAPVEKFKEPPLTSIGAAAVDGSGEDRKIFIAVNLLLPHGDFYAITPYSKHRSSKIPRLF